MNKENPEKYSLQITTLEAISNYSIKEKISFRKASFIAFHNLNSQHINCGFHLKTELQFYNSIKKFKSLKFKI